MKGTKAKDEGADSAKDDKNARGGKSIVKRENKGLRAEIKGTKAMEGQLKVQGGK